MLCKNCDHSLEEDFKFCPYCAIPTSLPKIDRNKMFEVAVKQAMTNNHWRTVCERLIQENDLDISHIEQEARERLKSQEGKNVPLPEQNPTPEQRIVEFLEIFTRLWKSCKSDSTINPEQLTVAINHIAEVNRYFMFGSKARK